MSRTAVRPYLVAKDEEGRFRVTVRVTRFNSQGYPLVTSTLLDEHFATATLARNHVYTQYRATAADIATS